MIQDGVRLQEIAVKIDYGLTASAVDRPTGPRFLRITDIRDESVDWSSVPSCDCGDKQLADNELQSGDIVFARTGATTGKSYLIENPPKGAVFASYLIRVRPSDAVEPKYLGHFFRSTSYWRQIQTMSDGAAQPGVNSSKLKELLVPLPPIKEQKRIAEILDEVEIIRRKRQQAIRLTDHLLRSVFLDMFGDPVANPKGWPMKTLDDFTDDWRGGASIKPDAFQAHGFPVLHKGAIGRNGVISFDSKKKLFTTPEYAASKSGAIVDHEFLAVTLRDLVPAGPSIGLIANVEHAEQPRYLLAQGAYGFRLDTEKMRSSYLIMVSNSETFRHVIRRYAVGSTQIHIRVPIFRELNIPVPPVELLAKFEATADRIKNHRSNHLRADGLALKCAGSLTDLAFSGQGFT